MSPLSVKLDIHYNGEVISSSDDRKLVGQIPFKDRTVSMRNTIRPKKN